MIKLQSVSKQFKGDRDLSVLTQVDLRVRAGETVLLSGASGSGKTTLTQLLYRAASPDTGTIKIFDHDLRRLARGSVALLRRRIGIITQVPILLEQRTALQNVEVALEVRKSRDNPRVDIRRRSIRALADMGLTSLVDEPVAELSGSERQRVAIARALVGEPSLIVADEPTTFLDASASDVFIALVNDLVAKNGAALIASNDPRLVAATIDHGWGHLELRGGHLLDPLGEKEAAAGAVNRSAGARDRSATVVPFPVRAQAGGQIE